MHTLSEGVYLDDIVMIRIGDISRVWFRDDDSETLADEPHCIGRLVRSRHKSFDMHYVGRDGTWAAEVERWKYRDVTRVEVGGRYLEALNRFADPYPWTGNGGPRGATHAA